jgi:DNA-binding GntR family transcriptional regulator
MPEAAPKRETPAGADVLALRRQTIAAQVRAVLRRDIIAGRLLPRAMLSEQELSQRFGVSRTPIREALIKLSEETLVEIYPQYGSFVAPIKLREVFDSQFVRESLECSAVERAVERIEAGQVKALAGLLQRQRVLHRSGDHDEFFLADERMHALIMEIAGHANAWRQVENAKAQMDRVRFLSMRNVRKRPSVIAEHTEIVDCLMQRDRAGAVAAMRSHLRGLFRSVDILAAKEPGYFVDDAAGGSGPPPRAVAASRS